MNNPNGSSSRKTPMHIPNKTTLNLAMKEQSSVNWVTLIIGLMLIAVIVFFVAKFGVIDQYARLNKAEQAYNALVKRNNEIADVADRYPEVLREYRMYSRSWLSSEDSSTSVAVNRLRILDLIEREMMTCGHVSSFRVNSSVLTVNMSGMNLTEISAMIDSINESPIVLAATLNIAKTDNKDIDTSELDFTITVYLCHADEIEEEVAQQ